MSGAFKKQASWGLHDPDPDWMQRGACREHKRPDLWFNPADAAEARRICRPCPVVRECRAWATANPMLTGIWGDTDDDQRKLLRAQRGGAK
jgi:WhiB family redox-sensing transcriptional regulator